jgi:hypothetical protein
MGLDSVIRGAVATINSTVASLRVSVSHAPWTGPGADGRGSWGTATARLAIVDENYRQHKMPTGEVIACAAMLIFLEPIAANGAANRREPVDQRDVFTLPSGHSGPVVDTPSGLTDPVTLLPYMAVVVLG